jgi:acylpyruvate hydrolase
MAKLYSISRNGLSGIAIEKRGMLVDFNDLVRVMRRKDATIPAAPNDMLDMLRNWAEWERNLGKISEYAESYFDSLMKYDKGQVKIDAPVKRPPKVLALAVNKGPRKDPVSFYGRKRVIPEWFIKLPETVIGNMDTVELPPSEFTKVTIPETELGVIIGGRARWVDRKDALDSVAGYTVFNDVSASDTIRDFYPTHTAEEYYGPDWMTPASMQRFDAYHTPAGWNRFEMKCWDTFCPIGPCMVTKDEIPDYHSLTSFCEINGKKVAEGNKVDVVWDVEEMIHKFSLVTTLVPGDTMTIGEIADRPTPTLCVLKPGDVMSLTVSKIGTLTNPVVASPYKGVW